MYSRSIPHASILHQLSADVVRKIWQLKGPVILGHGLTKSHGEREKAPHRESAPGKFPGGHRITFRGRCVHLLAAANQFVVKKFVTKHGCLRGPNHL